MSGSKADDMQIQEQLMGVRSTQGRIEVRNPAGEHLLAVRQCALAVEEPEFAREPVGRERRCESVTWKCRCGKLELPLLPSKTRACPCLTRSSTRTVRPPNKTRSDPADVDHDVVATDGLEGERWQAAHHSA